MSVSRLSRLSSLRSRSFATSAPLSALSATALPKAEQISAEWKGTSATGGTTKNFIGGQFVDSKTSEWVDVLDPVSRFTISLQPSNPFGFQSTQTLLSRVPQTTNNEFEQAVDAASQAFKTWSRTSIMSRQKFVLECVKLLCVIDFSAHAFTQDYNT